MIDFENMQGTPSFEKEKYFSHLEKCECPDWTGEYAIPKKNAWIVFLVNRENRIRDLQVYPRFMDEYDEKIYLYVETHLKYTHYKDIGCVCSDWDEWSLDDVLFKLGFSYGFVDQPTMIKCARRLRRIDEFQDKIHGWLYPCLDSED